MLSVFYLILTSGLPHLGANTSSCVKVPLLAHFRFLIFPSLKLALQFWMIKLSPNLKKLFQKQHIEPFNLILAS